MPSADETALLEAIASDASVGAKMLLVLQLLVEFKARDERTLIFSKNTDNLSFIQAALRRERPRLHIRARRVDGTTSADDVDAILESFGGAARKTDVLLVRS